MKIVIVILILGACNGIKRTKSKCPTIVSYINDPHCGFLPDCVQSAANKEVLEILSCQRREKDMPDFWATRRGRCGNIKPQCKLPEPDYSLETPAPFDK